LMILIKAFKARKYNAKASSQEEALLIKQS